MDVWPYSCITQYPTIEENVITALQADAGQKRKEGASVCVCKRERERESDKRSVGHEGE